MPLPSAQLPAGPDWIARKFKDVDRRFRELAAAPRMESTTLGSGAGLKVAAAGGPTITITADPTVLAAFPTAQAAFIISTGLDSEVTPGYIALSLADDSPGLIMCTPDVGQGTAQVIAYSGAADGTSPPAAYMSAGQYAEMTLSPGNLELFVNGTGGGFQYDGTAMVPVTAGAWTTLPLSNSWTAYGGTFQGPQYAKAIDGTVMLDGQVAPGTKTAGTTVGTLPANCAPTADHTFRVSAGASGAAADIIVRSSGAVQIQTSTGTVTWLSLSGCRFPAATI